MSYLTAILQVTARSQGLPLDDMAIVAEVTNSKEKAEFPEFATDGAYITGFFLEGAGWELGRGGEQGYLTEMQPKELHPVLPVVHITAVRRKDRPTKGYYDCPVYTTSNRGATIVINIGLKMESEDSDEHRWILAGVALIMQPE